MKAIIISILSIFIFPQSSSPIEGKWKLVSYDAIDKIRNSPAYVNGNEYTRNQIENQFELILSKGEYDFSKDELIYTDIEGDDIKYRRAEYNINGDTLFIEEIERDFNREALIRFIDKDSLVLVPILEGKVGTSNLIFKKQQ